MALQLTNGNFQAEVLQAEQPVLIDFYADWCMPCKMLAPVIEEISQEGVAKVCKVNVEDEVELAERFSVMSIPTLVVMKNGKVVHTATGLRPKRDILDMLAV